MVYFRFYIFFFHWILTLSLIVPVIVYCAIEFLISLNFLFRLIIFTEIKSVCTSLTLILINIYSSYLPCNKHQQIVDSKCFGSIRNSFDMTSYVTLYILFIIHVTSGLKQFHPTEVLHIVENSCLFALTISDNDDVYKLQNEELLQTLSETTFSSEPAVHIGYINLETFIWPNNQHLKTKNNEQLYNNNSNMVLFPKTKVDRTCLLTSTSPPPKVFVYKGAILINRLVDFINVHCDTFRTVKGSWSYEGLHREEIIKNLFSVESVSEVTSEQVFHTHLSDQEPCDKSEEHFCVKSEHSSLNYNDGKFNEMPKCERISMPTKDYFFHNFLKISKPVIIEGGAKMWPAMSKWSNKFLREEYGIHDVHIKLTPGGELEGVESSRLWDNFGSFKIPDKVREQLEFPDLVVVRPATLNMKFSELVDLIENVSDGTVKNVSAYLEYSSIPDHLPDLEDDIEEMPFINDVLKREHLNIWFSDGNTLGKLHFDQFDNFLCQVYKCINFVFLDY